MIDLSDVSKTTFEDYVQIGFSALQYSNFSAAYDIGQSGLGYNSILRTVIERTNKTMLETIVHHSEIPYDIKYFIIKNTDFLSNYNLNSDNSYSYEMLMDGYSSWAKPKEYYLKKRKYTETLPELKTFEENNDTMTNFEVNVHCHFVFNLLNNNSKGYPEFKRKQQTLRNYNYPRSAIIEIQEILQTNDKASLEFFAYKHEYLYSLMSMAYNPVFISHFFDDFMNRSDIWLNLPVIYSILRQEEVSTHQIAQIYDSHIEDNFAKFLVARHPNVPHNILLQLCDDSDSNVVNSALTNAKLDDEILWELSESSNVKTRRIIARNSSLDINVLSNILENDNEDSAVRFNALFNKSLPDMYRKIWFESIETS